MQPSVVEVGWFNIQHVSFNVLMFISLHDGALDAEDETDIQKTKLDGRPARLNCRVTIDLLTTGSTYNQERLRT